MCSRRLQQTAFSDAFFLGALRVNVTLFTPTNGCCPFKDDGVAPVHAMVSCLKFIVIFLESVSCVFTCILVSLPLGFMSWSVCLFALLL